MSSKIIRLAAIMTALTFIAASGGEAFAQHSTAPGYCPPGTCAQNGGKVTKNPQACKKQYCKKK